jgi:cation-transporting ATPase I
VLGHVVVRFEPARVGLSAIVAVIDDNDPHTVSRGRFPRLSPSATNVVSLGADLLGAGFSLLGRAVRIPPLPVELNALPAALDIIPKVGQRLQSAFGREAAEVGTNVLSALVNAGTRMSLTSVSDAALRGILLAEAAAQRSAWASRASDLYRDAKTSRATGLVQVPRPVPLTDGPIERYAQRIATVALIAAGAMAMLPGTRRRAAQAMALGSPRGARLGREAFAGRLGRLLARRSVLLREPAALRRLDRINAVVIEAPVLVTGRLVIREVALVQGTEQDARDRAAALLDARADRVPVTSNAQHSGWALEAAKKTVAAIPPDQRAWLYARGPRRSDVLALTKGRSLVALIRVEEEIDPLGTALIAAARKVGRVLIAGATPDLAKRLRADATIPGGSRLAGSIRALQSEGLGVALVAGRNDVALGCADCGIGVLGAVHRPPWGAHLLAGPGLESAWLVLESVSLAKRVSGNSARLSLLSSVAGALLALVDQTERAGRRALTAAGAGGMANLISALWSARALGRITPPVPEGLVPWHALPIGEVIRLLDSSSMGVSEEQARQRRGRVTSPQGDGGRGLLTAVLAELDTPLTAPLAAGAAVSAAAGSGTDAILVLAVILANAMLSAGQEVTARRAMRRLLAAGALHARLCRAGEVRIVAADALVPGDLVYLEAGDAVPADCRLIEANGLEVDESPLTGESAPVEKDLIPTFAAAVAERTCMVYDGTSVVAGSGAALVVATGEATEAGRSARMAVEDAPAGGVEARLRTMAEASIPVSAAAAAAILLGGVVRGRLAESVSSAVALAVAAIPEGLPFVATAAEVSASKKLARHNILVRNKRAMEALGRVDIICFDKTGTLTEGRIRLAAVSDGHGHRPFKHLASSDRRVIAAALRASPPRNGDDVLPHPTDRAVVEGGESAGVAVDERAVGWRMVREIPFEPGRGFHAVLGRSATGQMISVKGAPEIVLPRCTAWCANGRSAPFTDTDRSEIDAEIDRLAQQGLRVLAVAERIASRRREFDEERVERLEFLGLLGLADATRPSAAEAVRRLRAAGIKVVMLTGDHPSTAEAIGAQLNLIDGGGVVTGADLDDADDLAQEALVAKASVFARVSPAHKVEVVRALRRAGHVVAVTGDGANDAPAIRLAEVGISLGDRGTAAARQASDMIVVDGRIETIADAVIAGRAMWASVRDAVALLLGGNLGEILFIVGSSALSSAPPLNTRQILFVNLMTDLLPALTVASRNPRHVTLESLAREGPELSLGTGLSHDVAQRAVATALATAGGWLAARFTGTSSRASSVAVGSLVASQLAQTLVAARGDPAVLAAVGVSAAALIGAVQTPGLSLFFGSRPLGPVGWSIVGGAAIGAAIVGALPTERLSGLTRIVEQIHNRLHSRAVSDPERNSVTRQPKD